MKFDGNNRRTPRLRHLSLLPGFLLGILLNFSIQTASANWEDVTDWKDGSGSGDWNTSNWYNTTRGWDNHNPNYEGYRDLRFNNNNQLSMNNNFSGDGARRWRVTFASGNTSSRTIGGSTENIFNTFGHGVARIQNDSTGSHTINFPFRMDDNLQINPVSGDLTIGGAINNNAKNIEVFGNNSKMLTLSGIVSGSGKLIIKENSKVKISNASTYTGNSELDAGELWFATGGSANSSTIWIGNGGAMSTTAKVWIESGGTTVSSAINVNNGNANTRVLGGLNTSGTATYSGSIGVNNGDLNLEANNAGGTVEFTGAVTTSSGKYVTASGPGLIILSGSGNNTGVGANVNAGTLRLAKASSASVRALNATPIVNSGGTLQFGGTGGDQLPDNVAITVNSGGRVDMNGVSETVSGITLNGQGISSSGALLNNGATASTLTGAITLGAESWIGGSGALTLASAIGETGGAKNIVKVGSGTTRLSVGNTYSGVTYINNGTLRISHGTQGTSYEIGDVNGGNNAALNLDGGITLARNVTIRSGSSGNTLFLANTAGTTGTATFSGNLTLNKGLTVYANTGGGVALSGSSINLNSHTLTIDGDGGTATISGVISGAGGLTKNGSGNLEISQNNTFDGNVTINGGKVTMSHGNALGDTGTIAVNAGADLEVTGGITVARNLTLSAKDGVIRGGRLMSSGASKNTYSGTVAVNNSEFDVASGSTLDVTGQISGSGTVTKTGAGELQLSNNGNNYTGITDVQNGTLTASTIANSSTASTIGSGSELKVGSASTAGTFKYTGSTASMNRTVTVGAAGGTINVNDSAATMTLNGTVTGSGNTLTKTGGGTLALGSGASVSMGTIAVQQGTLLLGAANQVGASTGAASSFNMSAGTTLKTAFDLTGNVLTLAGTSSGADTIFDFNSGSGNDFTFGSTSWSGGNLKLSNVSIGTVVNFGTFSGSGGSFNEFQQKISFSNTSLQAQINFSGTSLTVAAIPEPRVYAAAAGLVLLIGWAEFKRRRGKKLGVSR